MSYPGAKLALRNRRQRLGHDHARRELTGHVLFLKILTIFHPFLPIICRKVFNIEKEVNIAGKVVKMYTYRSKLIHIGPN
jgi:hypothetical protein